MEVSALEGRAAICC